MTGRELLRWSRRYERRAGGIPGIVYALVGGGAIAALVAMERAPGGASHTWLAAAILASAIGFMRVPFHLYWRSDAALLAQLPIEGGPLFDVALYRCVRAAALVLLAMLLGAIPLALLPAADIAEATRQITATPIAGTVPHFTPLAFYLHHAVVAGVLALATGLLVPGVVVFSASMIAGTTPAERESAGAILGAIPGAVGALIIVAAIVGSPWLLGDVLDGASGTFLVGVSVASVAALVAARTSAPRVMATILRDVSALDRQRLAALEIRPPTALERAIASLLGDAALPYRKDARLMRRRYPMAFALGALVFLVLAIVGLAQPASAVPWLAAVTGAAILYGAALAGRLVRPPIELPRLSSSLPISSAARRRAKLAWVVSWSLVFVVVPLAFAVFRVR